MVKHTKSETPDQSNETPPKDEPPKPPAIDESKNIAGRAAHAEAPPKDEPAQPAERAPTPLAAAEAEAQKKADEGKPDPLAQSKITGAAGAHGDLAVELAKLPPIPALDGLRANAAYYRTVGKDELISALKGLPFEDEGARTQRDWLVQRAESGEFSRG